MKFIAVSIADTQEMARTLDRYLHCFFDPNIESYFMTYEQRLLSGSLFRKTDLFLLELLRRDNIGYRAEAIPAAEKWAAAGKRVLIISGAAKASRVNSTFYWDLASADSLHERITTLLDSPVPGSQVYNGLKQVFAEYSRPAASHHPTP